MNMDSHHDSFIDFKVVVYKALNDLAPPYLKDLSFGSPRSSTAFINHAC